MLVPRLDMVFIHTCNGKYSRKDIRRFLKYIKINKDTGCWEWTGYLDKKWGYGNFKICKNGKRKSYLPHRVAIEISTGRLIPEGMLCCHHCDNPRCVNVLVCLFLGTNQDNMTDMVNKGRQPKNNYTNNPNVKLTWIQVKEIRRLWSTGKYTCKKLAFIYCVTRTNIYDIVNNKTWRINVNTKMSR